LSLLQRILGAALGVVLFILALVFASVVLAIAGGIALGVWAWLAWKTRGVRKEMEKDSPSVIEGEYRVETEVRRLDEPPR
jgi:Mn2+/Fe2+ NRAMP family transporter